MKSISLTKKYTTVMVFLFIGSTGFAAGTTTPAATTSTNTNSAAAVQYAQKSQAQLAEEREARLDDKETQLGDKCRAAQADARTSMYAFLAVCKEEHQEGLSAGNGKKYDDATKACRDEFNSCQQATGDEIDFTQTMTQIGGMDMSAFQGLGGSTVKKCSKYSQDKYDSLVEKMESQLETKNKDMAKLKTDLVTDREKAQEKYNDMQKSFIEAQEKKEQDAMKRKEASRDQEAAYDKQVNEYNAKIRETNAQLFQLQQQQALMVKQRGIEVTILQDELMKCQNSAMEAKAKMQSNLASGQARVSNNVQKAYENCRSRAFMARDVQVQKYKGDMATMDMNVQMKSAELQSLQQSAQKLAQMYTSALSDKSTAESKEDEAFLQKQQQAWLQMNTMTQNMQQKELQNQQAIQTAQTAINTASNKLADLNSQEPVADTKTLKDMRAEANKARALETVAKETCDSLTTYKNDRASGRLPAQKSQSTSTGTGAN